LQNVGIDVVAVSCSTFVPIAESGVYNNSAMQVISNKLQPIAGLDFDTVILGCTHFGLIQKAIGNTLGCRNYVQCGKPTAKVLFDVLRNGSMFSSATKGSLAIYTTGKNQSAINICNQLSLHFDGISLVKI
jgi:glutamate racemase